MDVYHNFYTWIVFFALVGQVSKKVSHQNPYRFTFHVKLCDSLLAFKVFFPLINVEKEKIDNFIMFEENINLISNS